jgi:hypothetical protein
VPHFKLCLLDRHALAANALVFGDVVADVRCPYVHAHFGRNFHLFSRNVGWRVGGPYPFQHGHKVFRGAHFVFVFSLFRFLGCTALFDFVAHVRNG